MYIPFSFHKVKLNHRAIHKTEYEEFLIDNHFIVIAMNVEEIKGEIKRIVEKKKVKIPENVAVVGDEDEDEDEDEESEIKNNDEMNIIWFLVTHEKTGKYLFLSSDEVLFDSN